MDNKLVFEPTILTQYNWDKYNLLTNYTYYWQVHQAVAEYMTQYTWSKNEVLPDDVPSWDKYTAVDELAPKHYWLQYNVVEKQEYYYRKLRMNTTNHYTFTWNKAKTDYWYNYNAVGAVQVNKYTVKKYAAADTQTPQTYYYYDKYAVFRSGGSSYYEPFLAYRKVQEVVGYTMRPHRDGMIASIIPEGIEPQGGKGYKVALYYDSSTEWLYPTFSKVGACPYSSTTGNPSGSDTYSSYHQYYPYGSTNLDSNTSGFRDLMYEMAMKAKNGYSDGKALKAVYYIKDTDGNFYGFTPYTYYDWDDGLVHNVVKLTFSKLQNSGKKTCILCCPFKEAGFEYTPDTLNFYDGYVNENETPASAWDWCYIVRNNTGKNLPTVSIAEFAAPNSYKFITTTPLATPIDEPSNGYRFYLRHLKSDNTWNYSSNSQGGFSYFSVVDYCYKKETVAKEKSGNEYTTETILLHYDNLDDTQEYIIFDYPRNMINEYYDSQNDVWVEIDLDSRQDFAVNQQQYFIVHKSYSFDDYKTLTPYSTGTFLYVDDNTYWTNALVLTYIDEGWVDETATTYQLNISFPGNTFPQPKPSDYYPDDGRVGGYHYVYVSTTNNPTYSSSGYIYGDEERSTTQKDTSTVYFETSNNEPYKWYLNRTGTYQAAGSTYLGEVSDWNENAFPNPTGIKGDYYYRYAGSQQEPNGNFTKGTFIEEVVSSRSDTYPQDGYQDGYWYVYYGTVNTEHRYKYEKAVLYDVYKSYWYAYVPKNITVEQVEYRTSRGSYPTVFYWYDTDTFYNSDGFWDDELIHLTHPVNEFSGWLKEYRHLGNLQKTNYERYIRIPNWYCNFAIPRSVNINTITESDRELNSAANLYDMRQFTDNIMAKYNGFIYELAPDVPNSSDVYNNSMIAASVGVQRPYINKYQTIPLPGGGTISGEYPYYNIGTSKPWYRGLISTGITYTKYNGDVKYTFRGENDENYLNAGYDYRGMEDNPNPDYVYQYIEDVVSFVPDIFPDGEIAADGYYYEITNQENVIMGYHKGAFIENVSSSNPEAYKNNFVDFENRYYTYSHADANYSKGNYEESVKSFIETAYPQNGYVINDAWYVYTSSQEVIVGQIEINKSQLMGGVNYTQEINPSEDLMIGTPGAAQIDFTIFTPDASAATQYLGKDFTYYVKMNSDADWRQIGTFTLTKAELPDKQTAKIQGFDYIYKFDTIIDEWLDEQTFPMTLGEMFASLCEYVGCEAYSTDFTNSDFQVNDNFEAVQITGRTILQYITEASGGFCVAEPDGRIHLKHYAIPPTGAVNLGNNSYRKYTHEIYNVPVISSVVVRKDDDDEGVESNV